MAKYVVQRQITYEIEIEAESGEEAVKAAKQIPMELTNEEFARQTGPRWTADWDAEFYYYNEDDDTDEGYDD